MKRLRIWVLTVLALLGAAGPAHAWWGWIDELSGPRGFKGPQIDVRVRCLGAPVSVTDQRLTTLVNLFDKLATQSQALQKRISDVRAKPDPPDWIKTLGAQTALVQQVTEDTRSVRRAVEQLRGTYVTRAQLEQLRQGLDPLGRIPQIDLSRISVPGVPADRRVLAPDAQFIESVASMRATAEELIDAWNNLPAAGLLLAPVVGLRISLCKDREDLERKVSLNVLTRLYFARDASQSNAFAGGETMFMFTASPTFEWRPLYWRDCYMSDCEWWRKILDVADVGAEVGYYRIASKGFAAAGSDNPLQGRTTGVYATGHIPSWLTRAHGWTRAIPYVRYERLGFLDGFAPKAFGPLLTGEKSVTRTGPSGFDWTNNWSLFIDLGSIF